jgi:hypothetical protein
VAVERVKPAGLVVAFAAYAHVNDELEPVRIDADTADRHRHLLGADQQQFDGHRSGDHLIRLHPGRARPPHRLRRRRRLRDRVEKLMPVSMALSPAIR